EELLERARSIYEGEIDFKGQAFAEFITHALLSLVGAIAFLAGFIAQDIYTTLYIGLGGTALTFLLVAPPWPIFNKHPLPWLPSTTGRRA
ncbi:microsomal signal peptidase 12 kDa subunit, partial [Dissoconium aciculare CBS 342.82]|uniref:Signal peptidase complex subunit 1 n=1 Tax=Dissoconium aciculare CBS 342.82 TaxID=1314786 RepID=A0A6J3M5S6_9PEZI